MKKLILIALSITTALACGAIAFAQGAAPTLTATFKTTPTQAGTKQKPKAGSFSVKFNVNPESESTLSRIEYTIPKGVKLDGTGFPTCTVEFIAQNGDTDCPKGSQVGTGAATALLGPNKSALNFDVTVYVDSPKTLSLYLVTNLFTLPIRAQVAGGKVSFDIPPPVQQPVMGLYSYVTSVTANLGKQSGIPATAKVKGKTVNFASVVGCAGGKQTGGVKTFFANNPNPPQVASLETTGSSSCKAAPKPKK